MSIEELFKQHLQGREATPPAEAWERISRRLAEEAPQAARRRRWLPWTAAAIGVAALAVAMATLLPSVPTAKREAAPQAKAESAAMAQAAPAADRQPAATQIAKPAPAPDAATAPCGEQRAVAAMHAPAAKADALPSAMAQEEATETKAAALQPAEARKARPAQGDRGLAEESRPSAVAPLQEEGSAVTEPPAQESPSGIVVPNVVTPNGDGINDTWRLDELKGYAPIKVQIFTAQGKQVFSSANYDGTFSGYDLPDGNYFYVIHVCNPSYTRRGVLIIKR